MFTLCFKEWCRLHLLVIWICCSGKWWEAWVFGDKIHLYVKISCFIISGIICTSCMWMIVQRNCDLRTYAMHMQCMYFADCFKYVSCHKISIDSIMSLCEFFSGANDDTTPRDGGNVGCCGYILLFLSLVVIALTVPFSLCLCIKVIYNDIWSLSI